MKNFVLIIWIAMSMLLFTNGLSAQLKTAKIFANGMVLQRDTEIRVWGTGTAGDKVSVELNGTSATADVSADGKWKAVLPAMTAGGPYTMTLTENSETITRKDVYIGDVWLASGQSNMAMTLNESTGGSTEAAKANNQTIREFRVGNNMGAEPLQDVSTGSWYAATSANAGSFSATGYYFAKFLQPSINVPIGIINASKGGARIEAFMSEEMLGFDEKFVILANNEPERQPTMAFNTMINPLVSFPIKGIIWYQGESNADNSDDAIAYADLFKRMITAWRKLWGMGDIPFLWVQLPNQGAEADENKPTANGAWPILRACQSRALSLPNTGEVATIDIGEIDIHPKIKDTVGKRLSLVARKVAYGEDIIYSGPRFKDQTPNGEIFFDHVSGGLVAKNSDNGAVRWFSIAGADGIFYPAKAIIKGEIIIVSSDKVSTPVTVRYAWEYNPVGVNLYNSDDLPAFPFSIRVDNIGFKISSYTASSTAIERGKSAILTWETRNATVITLNDQPVDSTDGIRVWPLETTTYTLKAISRIDATQSESKSITIEVSDPLPTISIESNLGELVPPDTTLIIKANTFAPGGSSITQVEFFVDGKLISTDKEVPFEAEWNTKELGEYAITAKVTNNKGTTVESNKLSMVVAYLKLVKYEAETATFTGGGSVKSAKAVSGGKYLDLTDGWVVTFDKVNVEEAGEYYLNIRYLCNYEAPKTQNLLVNGTLFESTIYTAPNNSTWMTYLVKVPLNKGDNVIAIQGSWNWMSFDYIGIAVKGEPEPEPVDLVEKLDTSIFKLKNSPNPFNKSTEISFYLKEIGNVELGIYSPDGKLVKQLFKGIKNTGEHTIKFETGKLPEGVYFAKLKYNTTTLSLKMLYVK